MGGLGSGPSLKMGVGGGCFQSGPSLKNEGILELKKKKKKKRIFFFLKGGSFRAVQIGKVEQTKLYF